jgi:hypothetical protein
MVSSSAKFTCKEDWCIYFSGCYVQKIERIFFYFFESEFNNGSKCLNLSNVLIIVVSDVTTLTPLSSIFSMSSLFSHLSIKKTCSLSPSAEYYPNNLFVLCFLN